MTQPKSIYNVYSDLFKKKKNWRYYSRMSFSDVPFLDKDTAWRFIETYFISGAKESIVKGDVSSIKDRILHSVSVFFLGIFLSNRLLDKNYKENECPPDFRYLWFLTSLYHDYSYFIEKDSKRLIAQGKSTIEDIKRHLLIEPDYDLLRDIGVNRFSKEDIEKYFDYKVASLNELGNLIIKAGENDKKHKFQDDPFLFLLILADPLEPLKAFPNEKPEKLLKKIGVELSDNAIRIKVLDNSLDYERWFNNIEDIQTWMNLAIKRNESEIEIIINRQGFLFF
jgi:hypothetical protein